MIDRDISLHSENMHFRLRVSALIIHDGRLLAVRSAGQNICYTVGGRVRLGESSEEAVIREAYEETGIHLEIDRLLFIQESFFTFQNDKYHEIAFHYLMKPPAQPIPEGAPTDQANETLHWLPIDALPSCSLVPGFLKEALQHLPDSVRHIVVRE